MLQKRENGVYFTLFIWGWDLMALEYFGYKVSMYHAIHKLQTKSLDNSGSMHILRPQSRLQTRSTIVTS
jgi:hypothetical protein